MDKFIARGYTSSVGSGQGNWVAKSEGGAQSQHSNQPARDPGTSFVMGGSARMPSAKSERSEGEYSYRASDIHNNGTTGRGPTPSGCFGGGSRHADSPGGMDGQKGIMFIFLILIMIAGVMLSMATSGDGKKIRKKRSHSQEEVIDHGRRGQPVWYR